MPHWLPPVTALEGTQLETHWFLTKDMDVLGEPII